MATAFIGEHLIPGQLGYLTIIISFVAALFSAYSYFKAASTEGQNLADSNTWLRMGRIGFYAQSLSIIGTFGALYYIITQHLFEYNYAWAHSSLDLPGAYLLSCFWEGQEGSFMLWIFWHSILGLVVMHTAKGLESRVMAIIGLIQALLATMILGIYLGPDIKIGSTPFILLRQVMQNAPIFSMPNYLTFIKDGNGLNVTLQNYWMVIHPPVLFLGFASTLIPFAYGIAALWKGDHKSFVRPTLAWSIFGGAVLGTGIIMGGAWAYESLNFGGYWAWDPVENASLVPWLTFIAGLHTLLIYRSTKRAYIATQVFLLLTHLLVWYSTFLTRTGILGKTSVHAFTGDGQALFYHLLFVIGVLLVMSIFALAARWKSLPVVKSEEATWSREFWMFIGSAVLFISAVLITFTTSQPVYAPLYKWMTGKELAPPIDVMKSYNDVQVWIAIVIGLLSGSAMYMKYKNTDAKKLLQQLTIVVAISGVLSVAIGYTQQIITWQYSLMLYTTCFAMVASASYGITILKVRWKQLGAVVAHFGFASILMGILLSSYNKHAISFNTMGIAFEFGKGEAANAQESRENEIMFIGRKVAMGPYFATYQGDSDVQGKDKRKYYKVLFERLDSNTNKPLEQFMLYPDAFINPKGQGGLSANPSTKHYWDRDIYTFISQATDKSKSDTSAYYSHLVQKEGDTVFLSNGYMIFGGFSKNVNNKNYQAKEQELAVTAQLKVYDMGGLVGELHPVYIVQNKEQIARIEDTIKSMDLYVRLENIIVKTDSVTKEPMAATADLMVKQTDPKDDYIVLKALVFPYINVLWLGVVIMVIGFLISIIKLLTTGSKAIEE